MNKCCLCINWKHLFSGCVLLFWTGNIILYIAASTQPTAQSTVHLVFWFSFTHSFLLLLHMFPWPCDIFHQRIVARNLLPPWPNSHNQQNMGWWMNDWLMDGWMDGWMNQWMDGWINRWHRTRHWITKERTIVQCFDWSIEQENFTQTQSVFFQLF